MTSNLEIQSSLEIEGLRDRLIAKNRNDYHEVDEYNANHKDALSDGDPLGKGYGSGQHMHTVPNFKLSPTLISNQIDTTGGGGSYDIDGGPGALAGNSGRNFLKNINTYTDVEEYNANHKNAIADGDVQGKGDGHGITNEVLVPTFNLNTKNMYKPQIDTENAGGKYDVQGRPDLQNSGRNALSTLNLYGKQRQYGVDVTVNTDENVNDGQYRMKI